MTADPDDRSFVRAIFTVTAGIVVLLVGGITISIFAMREGSRVRGPSSFLVDPPKVETTPAAPGAAATPAAPDDWDPALIAGPSEGGETMGAAAPVPRRVEGARQPLPQPESGGLVDKRPGTHPDAAAMAEQLKVSMDEMKPGIQDCVQQWADAGAVFDGGLILSVNIGPEGLQGAEVVDVLDLPGTVTTCFAAAVWEVQWPDVTEPLVVTVPFDVDSDDSG